ncbi:MAG: hypothetical protein QXL82_03385 [Candidatus Aenigmatarchaeota archaeon]
MFEKHTFSYEISLFDDNTYYSIHKTVVKKSLMYKILSYILKKANQQQYENAIKNNLIQLNNKEDFVKALNNAGVAQILMNNVVKDKNYTYLSAEIKNIAFNEIDKDKVEMVIEIAGMYIWKNK